MKRRCSAICSLANFNIFIEMLLIPVALLLSRFDIISKIFVLAQVDIRNDSSYGSVK